MEVADTQVADTQVADTQVADKWKQGKRLFKVWQMLKRMERV